MKRIPVQRFGAWILAHAAILVSAGVVQAAPPATSATRDVQARGASPELTLPPVGGGEGELDARIVHALHRFGFGPRLDDVDRVRDVGLESWLLQQLDPQSIPDETAEQRLRSLETLSMRPADLMRAYPPASLLRGVRNRLNSVGGADADAANRLLAQPEGKPGAPESASTMRDTGPAKDRGSRGSRRDGGEGPGRIVRQLAQAKLLRAVYSERQLQEVMTDFWFNHFNVFIGKSADRWWTTSYERDAIRPHSLGSFRELLGSVARHPAMLFYLDNWLSSEPGARIGRDTWRRLSAQAYRELELPPGGIVTLVLRDRGIDTAGIERDIARRNARRDRAWRKRNRPESKRAAAQVIPEQRRRGLNENYARELLELHTLGVDGGYTQRDIVEVARCFTGWTLLPVHAGQGFVFVDELHAPGPKVVLGATIEPGGVSEGERVLDLLASHPSTARFVSTKLARRFVGDDPSEALVGRMAARFLDTGGDIREVLLEMMRSEELWDPEAMGGKLKTPFELVASAVRATGGEIGDRAGLLGILGRLGQPLYGAQPPTGYGDTAEDWISSGALLARMKLGFGIAANRIPGLTVETPAPLPRADTRERVAGLGRGLLGVEPPASTVDTIVRQLELDPATVESMGLPRRVARTGRGRERLMLGWWLASPQFQRR